MQKKCLWCLKEEPKTTFNKKAHTIPKSLGGQNYNNNVCDDCNSYYGNSLKVGYSIEEALKETFNITRRRLLYSDEPKRQVGRFKSKFFDLRKRNGKIRLKIKPAFRLNSKFLSEFSYYFKRGLYKMYLEELNRQTGKGFESKYHLIRNFARYGIGTVHVLYFNRSLPVFMLLKAEAETPILIFDKMKYLYSDDKFVEIKFLGHVFGFPITGYTRSDLNNYIKKSSKKKLKYFESIKIIDKITDVDLSLQLLNNHRKIPT